MMAVAQLAALAAAMYSLAAAVWTTRAVSAELHPLNVFVARQRTAPRRLVEQSGGSARRWKRHRRCLCPQLIPPDATALTPQRCLVLACAAACASTQLTEIYLCHTCSYQEISSMHTTPTCCDWSRHCP
jgi:hypothetical protein